MASSTDQQILDLILNIEARGEAVLTNVVSQLKQMGVVVKSTTSAMDAASTSGAAMDTSLRGLSATFTVTNSVLGIFSNDVKASFDTLKTSLAATITEIDTAMKGIATSAEASAAATAQANTAATASFAEQTAASEAASVKIRENITAVAEAQRASTASTREAAAATVQSSEEEVAANEAVVNSLREVSAAALETAGSMRSMSESNLTSFLPDLAGGLDSLVRNARLATEAFGLLGGAIGVVTENAAAKFQSEMNNIQGNTTLTNNGIQQLSSSLTTMASTSSSTLPQLGDGLMHIANLGYTGADAINILSEANKSANATGADVAATSNILAGAMRDYNAEAKDAGKYMNTFHLIAAEGNMTLEQANSVMAKVDASAANMGIRLDEAGAAVSALTDHSFTYATAGTQVVNILSHIVHPSKEAETSLKELSKATGVDLVSDFTAAGLQTKQLSGVLADLDLAFSKAHYSTAQAAGAMFDLIPAQRGGQGAIALTGTAATDFNRILKDLTATMNGEADPTTAAYARTTETLGFQMSELKNRVNLAAIGVGNVFLHATTDAVKGLNDFLGHITASAAVFAAWEEKTHAIETAIGHIGDAIRPAGEIFKSWAENVLKSAEAFDKWAERAGVLNAAISLLKGYIEAIASEVQAFVTTIEPAVAGLASLENSTHAVSGAMKDWFTFVGTAVGEVVSAIIRIVENFAVWETKTHALATAGQVLSAAINAIETVIGAVLYAVEPVIASFIEWENRTHTLQTLLGNLANVLASVISGIGKFAELVAPIVQNVLQWASTSDHLKGILAGLAIVIGSILVPAIVSMIVESGPLIIAFGAISFAIGTIIDATKHWGDDSNDVVNFIRAAIDRLANGFILVTNLIIDAVNGVVRVLNFMNDALDWVQNKLSGTTSIATKHIQEIQHLTYVSMDYTHVARDSADATSQVAAKLDSATAASTGFMGAVNNIKDALSSVKNGTEDFSKAFDTMTTVTLQGMSQMASDVKDSLDTTNKELADAGEKGPQLYLDSVEANKPKIQAMMQSFSMEGVKGAEGVLPAYLSAGQKVGDGYVQGILLRNAAAHDATLNFALNAVSGMGEAGPFAGPHGVNLALTYINGIVSQLGLGPPVGAELGNGVLQGVEGVIPAMGKIGAAARAAFLAGLKGEAGASDGGNGFAITNGGLGLDIQHQDTGAAFDSSLRLNGGITQEFQNSSVLAAIKQATKLYDDAVTKTPKTGGLGDTPTNSDPLNSGGSPSGKGGGGGGGKGTKDDPVADAIKRAEEMGKAAESLQKVRDYQRLSATTMDAIVADIIYMNDKMRDAAAKYDKGMNESTTLYAETTAKVGEAISKMADGFAKIKNYSSVGHTAMDTFSSDVYYITTEFGAAGMKYGTEMMSWAAEYATTTEKVGSAIDKMVSGLDKMRKYTSVGKTSMDAFVSDTSYMVGQFVEQGHKYTSDMEASATAFATTTEKVGSAIEKMATGLLKLAGYSSIGTTSMDAFVFDMAYIVGKFVDQGHAYTEDMEKWAEAFAATTEKVGSAIEKMAVGLDKIRGYSQLGVNDIENFIADTRRMTSKFVDGGREYDTVMLDQATSFATATEKVATGVEKMATALPKLKDYSQIGVEAVENFIADVRRLVQKFVDGGRDYDVGMRTQAEAFAKTTGDVADGTGKAIGTLDKLKNYTQVGDTAIGAFDSDLGDLMVRFRDLAAKFDKGMNDSMQQFGKTTGDVSDGISKALGDLSKMTNYTKVGDDSIGKAFEDLSTFSNKANDLATGFKGDYGKIKDFGSNTKDMFTSLDSAMKVLQGMQSYQNINPNTITSFMTAVEDLANRAANAATDLEKDDKLKKAKEFGDNTKTLFEAVKAAVEAFDSLQKLKGIDLKNIDVLVSGMTYAISAVAYLDSTVKPENITAAKNFSERTKEIFTDLKNATEFFNALDKMKDPSAQLELLKKVMATTVQDGADLLAQSATLLSSAQQYAKNMQDAAKAFQDGANAIAGVSGSAPAGAPAAGQAAGNGGKLPSHALGLDTVPYDGYVAQLHKDEAILPANIAEIYRKQKEIAQTGGSSSNSNSSGSGLMAQDASALGANSTTATTLDLVNRAANAASTLSKAVNIINSSGELASAALDKFIAQTAMVVQRMIAANNQFGKTAVEEAAKYAETGVKVYDLIIKAVDAYKAMSNYVSIDVSKIDDLGLNLRQIVVNFASAFAEGGDVMQKALAGANLFADTASKIVTLIAPTVDGFNKLREYSVVGAVAIDGFFADIHYIVSIMSWPLSDWITDNLNGANSFATTATAVGNAIKPAVDGLSSLARYVSPAKSQVDALFNDIHYLVEKMAWPLTDWIKSNLDGAKLFADTAKAAVDVIKPAVEGFSLLQTYSGGMRTNLDLFFDDLHYMITLFAYPLTEWIKANLDGATAFAVAAKSVVDLIKPAVEGFSLLQTYSHTGKQYMIDFANDIKELVRWFADPLTDAESQMLINAGTFADSAKKVVDVIKPGIDAFTIMRTYARVPASSMQSFFADLHVALQMMEAEAKKFTKDSATAFTQFGDGVLKNMDGLVKALDLFDKMRLLAAIPAAAFDAFFTMVQDVINRTGVLQQANTTAFSSSMMTFISNLTTLFDSLSKALATFDTLNKSASTPASAVAHLYDDLSVAVTGMSNLNSLAQQYYNGAVSFAQIMQAANQELILGMGGSTGSGNGGGGTISSAPRQLSAGISFGAGVANLNGGASTGASANNTNNVSGDTYNIYLSDGTPTNDRDMTEFAKKIADAVIEQKQRRSVTIGRGLGYN